jgi:peptidoglycan/xylan/chitin deacetylase (PgdA/CDA1 family)
MIRVPILMYHSIDDSSDGACVRPQRFEAQMVYLRKAGYQTVDLDAVYGYLTRGIELPAKPIVITFDDGYRDNLVNAYPTLKKYGMCATIFLPTDYVGFTNRWNAAEGVTQRPLLNWEEIHALANDPLISFQAHTCSHPRLTQIPLNQVREELKQSKEDIEDHLGNACHHFAYPFGDFNDAVRDVVEEMGFHIACSTRWGHNRHGVDIFGLYRIGMRNQDSLADFKRVLGEPPPPWKYYWLRLKSNIMSRSNRNSFR